MAYHILLVDDAPELRRMVGELLEGAGYAVTLAADCAQARRAWTESQPDAALLDVMLPDGDGFSLLEELRQVDPESAERLHPADTKRILRALEVYRETGKTISAHNAETRDLPPRYDAVWIGLQFRDRADMKTMIDRRVDAMVAAGLLEEVGQLLESGLPREATALQAIGYKEFLGVLDGTATVEEAVAEVKLRSRQYAKRQLTWLRRNPDIHWIWWEKDRDFARALQVSTEILAAAGVF